MLPLLFQADSVRLRVSRMHIFLLFHHSIFPMIFWCLSGHFWSDHKVQQTFLTDFRWTKSKPTPIVHWKCLTSTTGIPAHSQQKSVGITTDHCSYYYIIYKTTTLLNRTLDLSVVIITTPWTCFMHALFVSFISFFLSLLFVHDLLLYLV